MGWAFSNNNCFLLRFSFSSFLVQFIFYFIFCLISSYFSLFLLVIYDELDFLSFVQV